MSDPSESLRAGDVVRIASGWHSGKHIKHRVMEIVAPWGPPIDERPRIPSDQDLLDAKNMKKAARMERRAQRRKGEEIGGQNDT